MSNTKTKTKTKLYAVDIHIDVNKCLRLTAESKEDAEKRAEEWMAEILHGTYGQESFSALSRNGFEVGDLDEVCCSGEADEYGEIRYY